MKNSFTTSEVAAICQVSTRIVTKWFDNKRLNGYRLPDSKHRRCTYEDIKQFLNKYSMPLEYLEDFVAERDKKKQTV